MPLISIIIPNYNHAAFLELRIESVLQQTFRAFEIILIDDCSTDNSRLIIEKYKDRPEISQIIYNETNSGSPFKQWKKGIELAKGGWIWIAESDDIAEPDFLEEAAKAIEKFPSLSIFYCDSIIIDENGEKKTMKSSERKNKMFRTVKWNDSYHCKGIDEVNECLKFDCTVKNISSAVFKKDIAAAEGKEVDKFYYHGDWFFCLKASFAGNIYYYNRPLNYYRMHSGSHSKSNTFFASRYECFKILSLLYNTGKVTEKKRLLDYFTYTCLNFGLIEDGIKKGMHILKLYFATDRKLALKITLRILSIKLSRRKRSFFAPAPDDTNIPSTARSFK